MLVAGNLLVVDNVFNIYHFNVTKNVGLKEAVLLECSICKRVDRNFMIRDQTSKKVILMNLNLRRDKMRKNA